MAQRPATQASKQEGFNHLELTDSCWQSIEQLEGKVGALMIGSPRG
jgi:hypothetical protein